MWKVKGSIRYFLSILATTFVQCGVFIYAQKILSGAFSDSETGQIWQTFMLQVFFLAPYVVMIWPAGFFTNRFSKNKVLAWSSLFMTAFVIAQAVLVTCNCPRVAFWLSIGLSSGFAVHSAAKYAIVREMFGIRNLSYANAFLQIFSLIGVMASAWLAIVGVNLIDLQALISYEAVGFLLSKSVVIPWILTGVSVLGTVASFLVPKVKYEDHNIKFSVARRRLSFGWRHRTLRATIITLSMFWAMAQVFTLLFQDVSGSQTVTTMQNFLAFTIAGLMVGTIIAARNSKDFIETGFIPLGMIGASICMFLIPFMVHPVALSVIYAAIGLFGGMFLVPVNALLQYNTRPNNSGWVIALANLIQALVLVVFLFVYTIMVQYTEITTDYYIIALAIISVGVFYWCILNLPQALVRSLLRLVFSRYKIRVLNVGNIPNDGPVLLVGNHHSFIDWAMLQMACPRPLCIAGNKDHFEKWYLRSLLKRLGSIRIDNRHPEEAMKKIHDRLMEGHAVVIFPTGEVSRSPHVEPFSIDYSKAVEGTDAQVVPFYIQGLWGSNYSYSGSNMYGASAERTVTVAFGEPIEASTPANKVRGIIRKISIDAWNYSVSFVKPVGDSWIKTYKKYVKFGPAIYNPDGGHFSGYKLMGAVVAFSKLLKKKLAPDEKNVGIMLPPSPAGVIMNLALWLCGKTNVNLNYTSSVDNVKFCAARADVMLSELPLFHSFGLTVTTLLNLTEGCPIVTVADPTDVKTMARVCAEFRVTAFVATPTFLRAFTISRYVHPMALKYVRLIIAGAEALRPELATAFRLKFGKEIYEGYGCTETAPVASINTENNLHSDYMTMQVNNKPGTVGMALPGSQFLIVDPDTNEPLPTGEAGMILIGGCQVMVGYLKDDERTKSVITMINGKRYYRTGDKGYLDEDGFLTIVDRYSRFAKLGGEMVSLGAVEKKIQDTPVLEGCDYVVTSIPDSAKGEKIVLLYQGEKDPKDVLSELRASGFPPIMLPAVAFAVEKVPKLGTGKADFTTAKKLAKELAGVK